MTKQEIRNNFWSNESKVNEIRKIVRNPVFAEYLEVVSTYMDPFTPSTKVSQFQHEELIASGGIRALSVFKTRVLGMALEDRREDEKDGIEEFVKY